MRIRYLLTRDSVVRISYRRGRLTIKVKKIEQSLERGIVPKAAMMKGFIITEFY
jgi:hypothetical protein